MRSWMLSLIVAAACTNHGEDRASRDVRKEDRAFILQSNDGIVARTGDGSWSKVLVAGSVEAAAFDPYLGLIWFVRKGGLRVLDLRIPSAQPVLIASNVPKTQILITNPPSSGIEMLALSETAGGAVNIEWGKNPKVSGSWPHPYIAVVDEEQDRRIEKQGDQLARKVKLVGHNWLKENLGRVRSSDISNLKLDGQVKVDTIIAKCDGFDGAGGSSSCGAHAKFGTSGWSLVVTQSTCGDGCYVECLLFDPNAKRWATPPYPNAWVPASAKPQDGSCGDYKFDIAGRRFIVGRSMCELGTGCRETPGVLGWLHTGSIIQGAGMYRTQ